MKEQMLNSKNCLYRLCVISTVVASLFLSGCHNKKNQPDAPPPKWQHLTPEQKQLIVDQSFHEEMKRGEPDIKEMHGRIVPDEE